MLSIRFRLAEAFILGRMCTAMSAGLGMASIILFLQETSPTEIRGLISTYTELSVIFSNLFGIVCGLQGVLGDYLILLLAVAPLFNLLSIFLILFCPETPKFLLISRNNESAAVASLNFYRKQETNSPVPGYFEKILENIRLEAVDQQQKNTVPTGHNYRATDFDEGRKVARKSSLAEIWRKPYLRKAMLIGTASLVLSVSTGIQPMTLMSSELLMRAGLDRFWAEVGAVSMFAVNLLVTFLAMNLVDRFGEIEKLLFFTPY